jgi:[ribosomal protein S5]-alanine N-acetyltransferase
LPTVLTSPPAPFTTPRLEIRIVEHTDVPALMAVMQSETVCRYLPYDAWKSMDDGDAWFARMHKRHEEQAGIIFVLAERETRRAIGTLLFFNFNEPSARAEVGYTLGEAHWGKGLMREALDGWLRCGFETLGLRRIEAEIDPRNVASRNVLHRIGFVTEGLLRQRWLTKGELSDSELLGLLQSDLRPAL